MQELVVIRHRWLDEPRAEGDLMLFLHLLFVGNGGLQAIETEFETACFRFLAQDGEDAVVDRHARVGGGDG